MLAMPLYDEDGNEIPEEELPWNNMPDELSISSSGASTGSCTQP